MEGAGARFPGSTVRPEKGPKKGPDALEEKNGLEPSGLTSSNRGTVTTKFLPYFPSDSGFIPKQWVVCTGVVPAMFNLHAENVFSVHLSLENYQKLVLLEPKLQPASLPTLGREPRWKVSRGILVMANAFLAGSPST